jgi:hypothetical protein
MTERREIRKVATNPATERERERERERENLFF